MFSGNSWIFLVGFPVEILIFFFGQEASVCWPPHYRENDASLLQPPTPCNILSPCSVVTPSRDSGENTGSPLLLQAPLPPPHPAVSKVVPPPVSLPAGQLCYSAVAQVQLKTLARPPDEPGSPGGWGAVDPTRAADSDER